SAGASPSTSPSDRLWPTTRIDRGPAREPGLDRSRARPRSGRIKWRRARSARQGRALAALALAWRFGLAELLTRSFRTLLPLAELLLDLRPARQADDLLELVEAHRLALRRRLAGPRSFVEGEAPAEPGPPGSAG